MLEVRTMKLTTLRNKEEFLYNDAESGRREKALRFAHAEDRLRCLAAGYMMKHCLPGYSESLLCIGVDGKPYLKNGTPFSISHAGNYIVLAWCEDSCGVGVDVESIREMEYFRPILPYYATEEEQKAIGSDARKAAMVWTRKESLYKCVGEGISDLRELPGTLEESVLLFGTTCRICSWEEDGHMFSIALRERKEPADLHLNCVTISAGEMRNRV